ncbi:MAG: preprotein translocase subunit SecY [Chloroflexia bacterium]|nr:preprotein translocase subunit SecY [Chloroflexia bacterium]MDQ3413322.1 preprotein translocase subunit SecY [Chloroflexota bacterium]
MFQAVVSAFRIPDLRQKILFTLAMLVIFRFIATIPVPGVDREGLQAFVQGNQLLGMLNLFSGSGLQYFSIAALGVYPYITASIIMQLMTPIIPRLTDLSNEGQQGRNRINQYTHWLTVPLALLQGYAQGVLFSTQPSPTGGTLLEGFGLFDPETFLPTVAILASMTAGTMLLVWIGELITENGIGNGISIIIFGGIVASLPSAVASLVTGGTVTANVIGIVMFLVIGLITIVGIIMINEGQRRIPVHHAKRVRAGRVYGGSTTFIPLKVNSAGMIPLIFAVSIMVFPGMIAQYMAASSTEWVRNAAGWLARVLSPDTFQYNLVYFVMVVGFTYFYTMVIFQQQKIPENLQRQGAFIPGVRPGRNTETYLQRVLNRITLIGAVFLGVVAVLPWIASLITGVNALQLGATSMLIVVGVAVDTMRQLEAQLMMRNYEGFIR